MDNLSWGLGMTVAGMGIVFALLVLLWGLLALMMRLDNPPAPSPVAAAAPSADDDDADLAGAPSDALARDLVAAIVIAVIAHKSTRRHEAAPLMRSYWPGSLLYASRWVASGRMRQTVAFRRGRG